MPVHVQSTFLPKNTTSFRTDHLRPARCFPNASCGGLRECCTSAIQPRSVRRRRSHRLEAARARRFGLDRKTERRFDIRARTLFHVSLQNRRTLCRARHPWRRIFSGCSLPRSSSFCSRHPLRTSPSSLPPPRAIRGEMEALAGVKSSEQLAGLLVSPPVCARRRSLARDGADRETDRLPISRSSLATETRTEHSGRPSATPSSCRSQRWRNPST